MREERGRERNGDYKRLEDGVRKREILSEILFQYYWERERGREGERERGRERVINPVLTTTCLKHENHNWRVSIKYFKLDQDENVYWNIFYFVVFNFHDTLWGYVKLIFFSYICNILSFS